MQRDNFSESEAANTKQNKPQAKWAEKDVFTDDVLNDVTYLIFVLTGKQPASCGGNWCSFVFTWVFSSQDWLMVSITPQVLDSLWNDLAADGDRMCTA